MGKATRTRIGESVRIGIRDRGDAEELHGLSRSEYLRASPPLLEPDELDKVTRIHWSVPLYIFLPAIGGLAYLAFSRMSTFDALVMMMLGCVLWTLTEYWMHRTVFHFEPERGLGAKFHHLIHGVHHDHPNDPMRLVMPPSASVPLAVLFCLLFMAIFSNDWYAVAAGFIAGYLGYDMTHYALHHHVPKSSIGRRLREQHMRHHFEDSESGYGVSAPWWDHVFGTATRRDGDTR